MYEPLISVIIPAYQAEKTIEKCVSSVLNQTYHELEIILIDDGSLDRTGMLCDKMAERDNRIRVIHQENGGSSRARNVGLDTARGDWIGWVDADDWIEPGMYENLIEQCGNTKAEIGACGWIENCPARRKRHEWDSARGVGKGEALRMLLEDPVMQPSLWNKLWKRELYIGIRFPEGRRCDDISVTYQLFLRAKSVVCLVECSYHYVQRAGSAAHSTDIRYDVDYFYSSVERRESVIGLYPELALSLNTDCLTAAAFFWCHYCLLSAERRRQYERERVEMQLFVREHYRRDCRGKYLGRLAKLVLPLVCFQGGWTFYLSAFWEWLYRLGRSF